MQGHRKISIHALCEEGDPCRQRCRRLSAISIHALCEEGDPAVRVRTGRAVNFYPRPLRGGRQLSSALLVTSALFLSTPSARRATGHDRQEQAADGISIHALCEEGDSLRWCRRCPAKYFYPRPLRGGRRLRQRPEYLPIRISIHALCEEGDPSLVNSNLDLFLFLSTPSARRATTIRPHRHDGGAISIHALCEEGDLITEERRQELYISIHALCEEGDHRHRRGGHLRLRFLSTPSARRATA